MWRTPCRPTLEIAEMRALRAAVARGGVTRAARALNLSQSAVSHTIKRLETKLGRTVLERRTGGGTLTEDGRQLHDYACRVLALHDEALEQLGNGDLSGVLRMGMTEDMVASGLAEPMGRFLRRHPAVHLVAVVEQSRTLQSMLTASELDVAIVQVFDGDARGTDVRLGRDELVWIGPRDHDLTRLPDLPFIAFGKDCFYRHWIEARGKAFARPIRVVMECASVAGVVEAVRAGIGYALVTRSRSSRAVRVVSEGLPTPPAVLHVARLPGAAPTGTAGCLLAELTSTLAR